MPTRRSYTTRTGGLRGVASAQLNSAWQGRTGTVPALANFDKIVSRLLLFSDRQ